MESAEECEPHERSDTEHRGVEDPPPFADGPSVYASVLGHCPQCGERWEQEDPCDRGQDGRQSDRSGCPERVRENAAEKVRDRISGTDDTGVDAHRNTSVRPASHVHHGREHARGDDAEAGSMSSDGRSEDRR